MEKLCFHDSVSLFVTIMVIVLLLPRFNVSAQSDYTRPDKYYINCGSDSDASYSGRNFVGDMISGNNSVSFSSKRTEVSNDSSSNAPKIYQTVRIFRSSSSYTLQIDPAGLYFVRLHFAAFSTRTDLLTARFTVSATSGSNRHLKDFNLGNITETPRVEEFFLMLESPTLEIRFVPDRSSLAFINAIEVFSAPDDLEGLQQASDTNLHTIYRLNVGGPTITPENDTLGRTWSMDDDFLFQKTAVRNITTNQTIIYPPGRRTTTNYTAPDFVYKTAKAVDHNSSLGVEMMMNVTWSFKVQSNYRHYVRLHFCNINGTESSEFYLYVDGNREPVVQPSRYGLATAFYQDAVSSADASELLNVTIGQKEASANKASGFLNGIEVMKFLSKSDSESRSSSRIHIIAGCATAAASALILSLLVMVFLRQRRLKKKKQSNVEVSIWSQLPYRGGSSDNRPIYRGGSSDNRPISSHYNNSPFRNLHLGLKIPFTDILRATNNFDEQWLIGRGGFGDVYKAILPDGSKAAIKRGKAGSGQGILEFQTEIHVLSNLRHKHLVSLKGYCEEHAEMILAYEFMEKGTLKEHLYGSDFPPLNWKQRLEICIGAAKGLHYLHSGSDRAVIHRDVKSTNILLDENNVAKVADFGLSKLTVRNQDQTNFSTNIKGTFGYLDPEYLQTHILTEKSDVYAFGVLLLEILCARPALDRNLRHEEVNLAEWAIFCKEKGTTDEIIDPILIGQIEPNSLKKFMDLAEKCLKEYGDERPTMGDVIWDLEYVLRLQMLTIRREAHEDTTMMMTEAGSTLVIPRLMISDSFNTTSFVVPNESKESHGGTDSSESKVFSQLKVSEAR